MGNRRQLARAVLSFSEENIPPVIPARFHAHLPPELLPGQSASLSLSAHSISLLPCAYRAVSPVRVTLRDKSGRRRQTEYQMH